MSVEGKTVWSLVTVYLISSTLLLIGWGEFEDECGGKNSMEFGDSVFDLLYTTSDRLGRV